jgi:GNAT superfamily N-acetyltransferase
MGSLEVPPPIRRIRPDEGSSLRALRLRALADAPMAFGSTLAREEAFTDEMWRERAQRGASGDDSVTFVAEREGQWLGIATGLARDPDVPDDPRPELVGMFVCPEARGRGIGVALVDAVVDWAKQRRAGGLCLWVTATNNAAIALYARCGFEPTGARKPLAHSAAVEILRMVRDLA